MKKISFFTFMICLLAVLSCNEDNSPAPVSPATQGEFQIIGSKLLRNGKNIHYKGVNAMQTFGLGNGDLMDEWKIEIVREFIGNLEEQPITGNAIKAKNGVWYHSLEKIVAQNRAHQKITILCPFGWFINGNLVSFSGLNPRDQDFYEGYKLKMQQIAEHFKDQPDVWIEVWNEPYHWNNQNNYSHSKWLADMQDMVRNLRQVDGFESIIVVPGNEQGQSEDAILSKGKELLKIDPTILFDLHAYEKWLVNTTESEVRTRILRITENNFAVMMGEVGVQNVGDVMPVKHFLAAMKSTQTTTLAWLWNQNSKDNNALLTNEGLPNSTATNNQWGSIYRDFLRQ